MTLIQGPIQVRRDTATNWASSNPTLAAGEPGYDTTSKRFKIGDGSTAFTSLQWAAPMVLTPTAVKTATYTAVVGELVRVDATAGAVVINLPSAPAASSQIGVIKLDSTSSAVTVTRGGTDVFQVAGGGTTLTLPGTNRADAFTAVILQYVSGVWLPISGWATPAAGGGGGGIIVGRGAFASRPSGTNIGDLYECTDVGNEYRWNGSSWDMTRGGALTAFTPPPSSSWIALNSGSVSAALDSRLNSVSSGGVDNWKGEIRTLTPSSNYTALFYFDWALPGVDFAQAGIVLRDSVGGSFITFGPVYNSSSGGFALSATKFTPPTSFAGFYASLPVGFVVGGIPNWLRVRDDATNRFYEYSFNGVDWILLTSSVRTDFVTPDQIGWGVRANNSGGSYTATVRLRHLSGVS